MTDQPPYPGFQPPPPTGLQPPGAHIGTAPSGGSGPSGKGAKIAAIVLGVLLLAVAAGAIVLVSKANGDADDAKAELADVEASLDALESDAGSVEDQIDELVEQQQADEDAKAELQATIDEQNIQIEALTTQIDSAGGVEAIQAELDQVKAELEQSQADLEAANDALDAATGQPAAGTFAVEPASIRPALGDFSVVTNKVACDGFADPVAACPATLTLGGRFIQDGPQLFMEFANVAKVPIGSFDGFNYSGSTPATNEASSLCGGQVIPATMTVQIAPVRFSVDAATEVVTASAFSFTWTIASNESAECTGSSRTYTGTVDL